MSEKEKKYFSLDFVKKEELKIKYITDCQDIEKYKKELKNTRKKDAKRHKGRCNGRFYDVCLFRTH